jgi:hypothetical protein
LYPYGVYVIDWLAKQTAHDPFALSRGRDRFRSKIAHLSAECQLQASGPFWRRSLERAFHSPKGQGEANMEKKQSKIRQQTASLTLRTETLCRLDNSQLQGVAGDGFRIRTPIGYDDDTTPIYDGISD